MHTPQHHMPSGAAPPGCSSCPRAASSASSPRGRGFEHTAQMLLASSFSSVQCGHSHSVVGPPASPSPAIVATTPRGLSASVEARTKPSAPKDASARDPARRAPRCRATRRLPPRLRANYLTLASPTAHFQPPSNASRASVFDQHTNRSAPTPMSDSIASFLRLFAIRFFGGNTETAFRPNFPRQTRHIFYRLFARVRDARGDPSLWRGH